ncbi:MAG: thiolase family protein [Leptospira sp.]|nr:thiolase family protein [Leptospira sp.]
MNSIILGVADTIDSDIENYNSLNHEEKYFQLLGGSIERLFQFLGTDFEKYKNLITDYLSIEAAALGREGYGQSVRDANDLGITGIQCHVVDLGGASVAAAVGQAALIAENNPYAIVLVAGADIPKSAFTQISDLKRLTKTVSHPEWELPYGATLIGMYALLANKLMQDSGIEEEDFKSITKFFRSQAISNPRAFYYNKDITEKQISKYLAPPYSTPMIAIVTDHGFATLVVGSKAYEELKSGGLLPANKDPLYIVGHGHCVHAEYFSLKGKLESPAGNSAEIAYSQSGRKRSETEYAWIYDCFTGMVITQASGYFGENPKQIAQSLKSGKIPIGEKEIPINLGGGILNYQAAMSMSGATGLVDVLSQYNLADKPIPNTLDKPPQLTLMGNNGGIDSINSVLLFSPVSGSGEVREPKKPLFRRRLQLNGRWKCDPSQKEIIGTVLTATTVLFNPGGDKKPPYVIALIVDDFGNFVMANIFNSQGEEIKDHSRLIYNESKVRMVQKDGIWKGYFLEKS